MPTATDRDFLDMRVSDVRRVVHSGQDHHVALLQEAASPQALLDELAQEAQRHDPPEASSS